MLKSINHTLKWSSADWCLAWILFFSIVQQRLSPIGFGFWILVLIKNNQWSDWRPKIRRLCSGVSLWFVLYFLLLSVGLIWSENMPQAWSKLENKLSFVLFPILLIFSKLRMSPSQWKAVVIVGLIFCLLLNEAIALVHFFKDNGDSSVNYFLGSVFSQFMHRSYLACYLCIGMVFVYELRYQWNRVLVASVLFFFSLGILQTMSKIGLMVWIVLVTMYFIQALWKISKSRFLAMMAVLSLFVLTMIFLFGRNIESRFNNVFLSLQEMQLYNNTTIESNAARLIMWNTSIELLQEHWLMGLGTGDADLALKVRNEELGNVGVAQEGLNSHNQFLTTALQIGILGLGLLVWVFVQAWKRSKGNHLTALVVGVFFLNCLVESFLETQSGVVLFCVMMVLLFDLKDREGQLSMV
jgi:O-antigen ligase